MNVAMLQDGWWPNAGGGPVHVKELAIALAEEFGHEIDIFTRQLVDDGTIYDEDETYGGGAVTVRRLPPATSEFNLIGRLAPCITQLLPLFTSKSYDIVHGHTYLPAIPTRLIGALTETPTVYTVHGTAIPSGVGLTSSNERSLKRVLERAFICRFDYTSVISVNNHHSSMLRDSHENVHVIPNGVDVNRFRSESASTDAKRLLYLGRLVPEKRVSDLIDAFAVLAREFPELELVIVGSGLQEDELKRRVDRHDLQKRVSFPGYVPDEAVPEYYASADVFVLPSIWEGHPLTLLEAWASELPVVASDAEGIAEFVDDGETGYLVEPESPAKLADAIRCCLENPTEATEMAAKAYELVTAEYTWTETARRTNEVYRSLQGD